MASRTLFRGGTTEAMISASIALTSMAASDSRLRARMPYSSTVRSRTVVRRQWATRRVASYTPRTVLVFPTSITRSMRSPSISRAESLHDLPERDARPSSGGRVEQERALVVDAGHPALAPPERAVHGDLLAAWQGRERLPFPEKLVRPARQHSRVSSFESLQDRREKRSAIRARPGLDTHRRRPLPELGGEIVDDLVDVHPDPDHHVADARVGAAGLPEDSRDLASAHHDIVGPLDAARETTAFTQRPRHGDRGREREQGRPGRRHARAQDDRDIDSQ